MISITISDPDGQVKSYEVANELTVGRDPSNTIILSYQTVSRAHCRFMPTEKGLAVEDLHSKAGTFVNERKISGTVNLLNGDLVKVGPVRIMVHLGLEVEKVQDNNVVFGGESVRHLTKRISIGADQFSATRRYLRDSQALGSSLEQASEQLEALLEVATTLSKLNDRSSLFQEVAKQLLDLFKNADRVVILEADDPEAPTRQTVKLALFGPHAKHNDEIQLAPDAVANAVHLREACLHEGDPSADHTNTKGVLCAPLVHGDQILGALYLDSRTTTFSESTLRFLSALANIVATALQNVRLFEAIKAETTKRANLARYFSKDLVERIVNNKVPFAREGKVHSATIILVDLCGFSRLTNQVAPKILISSLNSYFGAMQRLIFQNRGTVERFGGDSILAYWGVVETDRHSAWRGCLVALKMQNEMLPLNEKLVRNGTPTLSISVGVNSGPVVAGDVGSEERYEFTVLGDAVNMTRRLQDFADPGQVLVGEETVRQLGKKALVQELPARRVKGRDIPLKQWWLYGLQLSGTDGVEILLALGVFIRDSAGHEAHGRCIEMRYSRSQTGQYRVFVTLSLFSDVDVGESQLTIAMRDQRHQFKCQVVGDLVQSEATAYWSAGVKEELIQGMFEVRVKISEPTRLLTLLGVI